MHLASFMNGLILMIVTALFRVSVQSGTRSSPPVTSCCDVDPPLVIPQLAMKFAMPASRLMSMPVLCLLPCFSLRQNTLCLKAFRQRAWEKRLNMKEVILAPEDHVVRNNL